MKKYRLKKDTPALKAGMFFELKDGRLFLRESEDCVAIPVFQIDGVTNFDEWFEEVKEFREFVPRRSEQYKCMNDGGIVVSYNNEEDKVDSFSFSVGNCYPLDTPDETIIKEQKLIPQAMHRLKMAAKKAWFEFNGSEGPDWDDLQQRKFEVCLDRSTDELYIMELEYTQRNILPPFPTPKSTQAYIDSNKDDLKLLFGVE